MPVIYRTDDATRWGTGKGANLTPTEVDGNFWDLAERLVALETGGASPNGIDNIAVTGSQMTVFLDDGTALGPYTLPTAMIRYRGDWASGAAYAELDLVAVPDAGIYLVLRDHTAGATFDPSATDGSGNQLYRWLFPMSGRALGDLSDVTITTPAAGHFLTYDDVNAIWINAVVDWIDVANKPATFPPDAHTHPSGEITDFAEAVDDRVAALLVAGTNVTLTYDDAGNTLTLDASGGGGGAHQGFRAGKSAAQSLAAATTTEIVLDIEHFDTEAAFAANRFTVPAALNGKAMTFSASIGITAFPDNWYAVGIQRSGDGGTTWEALSWNTTAKDFITTTTGALQVATGQIFRVVARVSIARDLATDSKVFFSGIVH